MVEATFASQLTLNQKESNQKESNQTEISQTNDANATAAILDKRPYGTVQFAGDFVLNWLIPLRTIPASLLVLIAGIFVFFYINGVVRSLFNDVVLKAFLIDMANLEGLYRALSFLGLGLSLVGIGWLFQKFQVVEESSLDCPDT